MEKMNYIYSKKDTLLISNFRLRKNLSDEMRVLNWRSDDCW